MNEFDIKARDWDNNPQHAERAKTIAWEIKKAVSITHDMTGFEYGCGTGQLSFNLAGVLKEITLADSSQGMLEVVKKKIEAQNIKNMTPLLIDLEKAEAPDNKFDLLFTQMTMHHVKDIDLIISKFYSMLRPQGYLCIVDLFKEDGSFHGGGFAGHKGFDPEELKTKMEESGFKSVKHKVCFKMKRIINEKEIMFPLFLLTGQKDG